MEQIKLSRRSFFGGALALVAVSQLPSAAFASAPAIYGDGIHDDTVGLQAAFDGKPFRVIGKGVYVVNRGGSICLSGGRFKLSDTLFLGRGGPATVSNCIFDSRDLAEGKYILNVNSTRQLITARS